MSFVVSARKYRPQNFDELVGQDHIAKTLKSALKNDQLAHAFLFSGPRGVGKTTSARILAKVLNCQNLTDDYKACDTCSSCQSFSENASFNIFELDAASNNSVDHIRALNEQVRFQPQQGSYKIYIIDEVHMLSQAAFNAFLKTLEEPPPYAKFILATTEKHKIIPTILSRCQIFDFKRLQIKDIVDQLVVIGKKENRNIADDALHLIAQKADGAMRDALSIFDKVVSSVEGDISYKDVATSLNVLDYEYYFKIVDAAVKENLKDIMMTFDDIIKKGFEAEQFVIGLMSHLRDLLMVKDVQTATILETAESLVSRYENQAVLSSPSFLLSSLSILNDTDINLPRSQNKRLSVEIALSKICYINRVLDKKKRIVEEASISEKVEVKSKEAKVVNFSKSNPEQSIAENLIQENTIPEKPLTEKVLAKKPKKKTEEESVKAAPSKKDSEKAREEIDNKIKAPKIPQISTDIDFLINGGNSNQDKNKVKLPFNEENLKNLFNSYKDQTDSKSVAAAIKNVKLELKGEDIYIYSPNQIFLDFIKQESPLIEEIHNQFSNAYKKIIYQVSEETFPDYIAPKKPKNLTTKEKYDMLLEKNPDFGALVDEFKLKLNNN